MQYEAQVSEQMARVKAWYSDLPPDLRRFLIAGVLVGVGLALIGMPYALILGIFAGLTRAIPVIGPILGGIPIVLLAFIVGPQQGSPLLWIWVLLFFSLMHLVESKIIMPKFLGHRLHLHAAIILIVLLIGGEFFGLMGMFLMGMFLAAPVAALARVLVHHYVIRPRLRRPLLSIGVGPGEHVLRLGTTSTHTTGGGEAS